MNPESTASENRAGTIQTVGILAGGTIGASWATYFLAHGFDVMVAVFVTILRILGPPRKRAGRRLVRRV